MKKIISIFFTILLLHGGLFTLTLPASAQDNMVENITKRRPDRPANFSPVPSPLSPEVKQVQTPPKPWYTSLWERLVSFFR